jgi:DNA-binding LytR/AlgR family response regulator
MKALYITQKFQVPLEEIRYMQADINYTIVYTNNLGSILSSTTIKRLSDKIESSGFIRINRKYILNKKIIKTYNCLESSIMIDDGQIFVLSRRRGRDLRETLEQIMNF